MDKYGWGQAVCMVGTGISVMRGFIPITETLSHQATEWHQAGDNSSSL